MAIAAIVLAAVVGFGMRLGGAGAAKAWLAGCLVVPAFVLLAEWLMPYVPGEGASMWPVAMLFGGAYGAAASAVGVFVAGLLRPRTDPPA